MIATWLNPFSSTGPLCRGRRATMDGPIANVEMAEAWDGDEGRAWAAQADAHDRVVARHHGMLIDGADVAAGHHVLDVGCGNGRTTLDAARAASGGTALGVDLSGP